MHQGNDFTESAKLVIENTSWKVASPSWAIHACFCSCLLSILICKASYLWSGFWASLLSLLSSCVLAPSECLLLGGDEGIESDTRLERQFSSSEYFHRISQERGYVLYPVSPSSWGKSTSVLENGSSFCRCRQPRGNWVEEAPPGEIIDIKVDVAGGFWGDEGDIGISPYYKCTRLRWIAMMKGSECLWGLHLDLLMSTEGSHHT